MSVIKLAKQQLLAIIILTIMVAGLVAAFFAFRTTTETRRPAAVPSGPASITLSSGTTSFPLNLAASINLDSTIQNVPVDGFQVVANFTGTIPSNLEFQPQTPAGLELAYNTMIDTSGGKQLKLAYITANPQSPTQTAQNIRLGAITFTALSTGSMSVAFDPTQSIITQNQTAQDILTYPQSATYTFSPPCTTANPTLSLTPNSQTGHPGQSLEYTLNITNNDDPLTCSSSTFNITASPPNNWNGGVEATPLTIAPQNSALTLIHFAPGISTSTGSYIVKAVTTRTVSGSTSSSYTTAQAIISIPSPSPSPLPICLTADLNQDGSINSIDRSVLLKDLLRTPPFNLRSDINGNGTVDVIDYSLLVTNYNQTTGPCQ